MVAKTSVDVACYQLTISKATVVDFYKRCREICSTMSATRLTERIGGFGQTVEVDECQLWRRKHHRGRIPREIWVCGGLVRDSNPLQCFVEIVHQRDQATLNELLTRRIDAQSRVITDGWGGYENLHAIGFNHSIVNHSKNFVNPFDASVHTQNVENLWRCLRRFLNNKGTYTHRNLTGYICEFIFRKSFCNVLEQLLSGISEMYQTTSNN